MKVDEVKLVNESTQGRATNEALASAQAGLTLALTESEARLAAQIAQSEARLIRLTITVGAFVIAAITIIDKVL